MINVMISNTFYPLIRTPTRITHNTASLIDNKNLTNVIDKTSYAGILLDDISDHFPVYHVTHLSSTPVRDSFIYRRHINANNKQSLFLDLQNVSWDDICISSNPNEAL